MLNNFFIKNENVTQESYEDRLDSYLHYFLQNELSTEPHEEKTNVFNELIEFVIETIKYKSTNEDKYKKALNILEKDFVIKIKKNAEYYIQPIIEHIRKMQYTSDKDSDIDYYDYNALYTKMKNFVKENKEYNNLNLYLVFIHLQIIERIRNEMINMDEIEEGIPKMINDYLNYFCENEIQPDLNVLKNFIEYCIKDINSTKSTGGKRKSRRKSRKNRRKTNRRRRSRR